MVDLRVSGGLQPYAPLAFGARAVPRLVLELRAPEPLTRSRALETLCALVHDPERAYEAVRTGFLELLKVLLREEGPTLRSKTAELVFLLAAHSISREALLRCNIVPVLSELLDDPEEGCRRNTHLALHRLALLPAAAACMASLNLVPRLLGKVAEEEEAVDPLLLCTISVCVRQDALPAVAHDGVSVLGRQLTQPCPEVRRAAATALMGVSVPAQGKLKLCEGPVLSVLVGLLSDSDPDVQAAAAGAIMNTAVITKGKLLALRSGALDPLLLLVSSPHRAVCLNALRALTALADAPSARRRLLEELPVLQSRTGAEEEEVVWRAAQTAVRVVTWTP